MEQFKPVVGHHAAWGLTSSNRYKVEPFKLTPGSTDTMCVRVREKIDIKGVGTDVVDMEGIFTVRRDHPCPVDEAGGTEWGKSCIKTEFRSLELYGESPVFGTVRVHLDPEHSSNGEVGPGDEGSLAAKCVAHCYPTIELPDLGMKLTTNGQPVKLASKVVQIPPVGDVARSENSAALVDERGESIGEIISSDIEVGEIICSFPLGTTGDFGSNQPQHEHAAGHHDLPSGPSFYTTVPDDQPEYTSNTGATAGSSGDVHNHMHMHDNTSQPASGRPAPAKPSKGGSGTQVDRLFQVLTDLQKELSGIISELRTQIK
ncbi:MAG TPA: DUF6073 family protein [Flavisolibacter sp.]|nr:DUF6073 family protein [Flavisolibacter sp.]